MITDVFKKAIVMGFGIMSLSEEKVKEFIKEMESKGEVGKKEAEDLFKEVMKKAEDERKAAESKITAAIKDSFAKMNIATREDLVKLEKKVHSLEKKVKELLQEKEE